MKYYHLILISFVFPSCKNNNINKQQEMQTKIEAIMPGLGEYMSMVEYHHTNLVQSTANRNLERANYECDELMEVFEKIELLHNNHEKLKQPAKQQLEAFIYPTIKDIQEKIKNNDLINVENGVKILTNNCNSCHKSNNVGFINIANK